MGMLEISLGFRISRIMGIICRVMRRCFCVEEFWIDVMWDGRVFCWVIMSM